MHRFFSVHLGKKLYEMNVSGVPCTDNARCGVRDVCKWHGVNVTSSVTSQLALCFFCSFLTLFMSGVTYEIENMKKMKKLMAAFGGHPQQRQ